MEDLKENNKKNINEINNLNNIIKEKENEIKKIIDSNNIFKDEKQKALEELLNKNKQNEVAFNEQRNNDLKENNNLNSQLKEYESEILDIISKNKIENIQNNSTIKEKFNSIKEYIINLKTNNEEIQKELLSIKEEKKDCKDCERKDEKITELNEEINKINKNIQKIETENQKLITENTKLTEENTNYKINNNKYEEENENYERENKILQTKLEVLKQLDEKRQKMKRYITDIRTIEEDKDESRMEKEEKENEELRQSVDNFKTLLNEKSIEVTKYKNLYNELKNEKNNKILENINPSNTKIITDKKYKKLTWYLIYKQNNKNEENNYENYLWLNDSQIKKEDLKKYNKFESEEHKLSDLKEYIIIIQNKLKDKEEYISKLDYKNKKLSQEVQNKTAGIKNNAKISIDKSKNNNSILSNVETDNNVEKYKNLLDQINDSNQRELKLRNEVSKLQTQLKEKENFESGINHINEINKKNCDSGFLEEENNKKGMMALLNSGYNDENNNDSFNYKISEQKADEFLHKGVEDSENMYNNQMKVQLDFFKDQFKDMDNKYNQLKNQIQELFKNMKCDNKCKTQVKIICEILGYSPDVINMILTNKKKGINFS